jgi:hypothetical protein
MTLQISRWMRGPEGRSSKREPSPEESVWELENRAQIGPRPVGPVAKLQPSPEGLGINPQNDLSAVGAALNLAHSHLSH